MLNKESYVKYCYGVWWGVFVSRDLLVRRELRPSEGSELESLLCLLSNVFICREDHHLI